MKKIATDLTTKSAAHTTHAAIFPEAKNLSNSFLMTREEVARLLNCSKATVDALSRAGHIQPIETPLGVRYEGMAALAVWRRGKPWQGKWRVSQ